MQLMLADAQATEALGAALARALAGRKGAVIFLEGDLGAGKTTLARAFLRELGVTGTIRSPTYTLMEHYRTQVREVLHLDLYRLNDPLELHNLGLADYPPALMQWLVEWPQRGAGVLPNADICIRIDPAGGGRKADISGLKQAEEEAIDGKA